MSPQTVLRAAGVLGLGVDGDNAPHERSGARKGHQAMSRARVTRELPPHCRCPACRETFSCVRFFDQHRWHRGEEDGCWHPSELTDRGRPLVCRDGVWGA